MSDEQIKKLIQGAVNAVKNGDKALAKRAFLQAIKLDPQQETAWLGLVGVLADPKERLLTLQKALQLLPDSTRLQDAVKRLGITPEQLLAVQPSEPAEEAEAVPPPPQETSQPEEAPVPHTPRLIKPLSQTREMPSVTPSQSTEDVPSPPLSEIAPLPETATAVQSLPPMPTITLEEALARVAHLPQGENGVPLPTAQNPSEVVQTAREALAKASQLALTQYDWGIKPSRRAGEREILVFRLQIVGAVMSFLLVAGGLFAVVALNNEDVRKAIFAPTWTVSPTATATATVTPGVTFTPSPTPELTLTPSPTPPIGTPTVEALYYVPYPTEISAPRGVEINKNIEDAQRALENGRMNDALRFLEAEKAGTAASGDFVPYYYLVNYYLTLGDVENAQRTLTDGEKAWEILAVNNTRPLITLAKARLELIALAQLQRETPTASSITTRFDELLKTLEDTKDTNTGFIDTYLVLSQAYLQAGKPEDALKTLDEALSRQNFVANATLRLERAKIYYARQQYDDALHELNLVLTLEPYAKLALRLQVETALAKGDYGLGVIFSEQYLARYSGSVEALKLRGDSWALEGKRDLALQQYERALLGDETDPAFAQVLVSRSRLFWAQGDTKKALDDLNEAVRLLPDDEMVRYSRMQVAYQMGNDAVVEGDAIRLLSGTKIPKGDLYLVQAQVLLNRNENNDEALSLLAQAQSSGVSGALAPVLDETLARANFNASAYDIALEAINRALNAEQNGTRRLIRAQILEARAGVVNSRTVDSDLRQALRDYEFVLTWSAVYPYAFLPQARESYEALLARLN